MRSMLRPTLIVTGLTLASQVVALVAQAVLAGFLGASAEADVLFAALTLPQYVTTVVVGSLGIVFIPAVIGERAARGDAAASRYASALLNVSALALGALALVGMLLARPLVELTVPGLSPSAVDAAALVARFAWPSIVASGIVSLLTGLHQAEGRFTWAAFVPFLGAGANIVLLFALIPSYGAAGAALAGTLAFFLQAALLVNALSRGRWTARLGLRDPALWQAARLLAPLVLSAIVVRSTVVVDRYLASAFPPGTIAQLGYAFRVVSALAAALTAGLGAVLFPALSEAIARGDLAGFRATASRSLRSIWLVVAPIMAVGIALAFPGVRLVFERGAFTEEDARAVAALLQVYLVALVAIGLSAVTARAIYSLKATKVIAVVGAVEAIAYIGYAILFARLWGAMGIAGAFVLYYSVSTVWQVLYLGRYAGGRASTPLVRALALTGLAALVAGAAAWGVSLLLPSPVAAVLVGGAAALAVYAAAIRLVLPGEAEAFRRLLRTAPAPRSSPPPE